MNVDGNSKQPVLIMTGMHRSGTSLTASLLQSADLDIGEHLLEGNVGNVKGHFENLDFFNYHRTVLTALGLNDGWTLEKDINVPDAYLDEARLLIQKNASFTNPWGWKDPRTTLFLDFWGTLIPEAKFLLIYRSPWEVIDSLYRRGDVTFHHHPELALAIWINYNQKLLDFYHRFPEKCLLLHLKQIVHNPTVFIELLSQRFSLPLSAPKEDIYDASLLKIHASHSHRSLLIQRYFPDADALYQTLNSITAFSDASMPINQAPISPTAWLLKDWFDVCHLDNQVAALESQFFSSQAANHVLQQEFSLCLENRKQLHDQCQHELAHAHAVIAAMQTSKFWKLRTQWMHLKRLFHLKE